MYLNVFLLFVCLIDYAHHGSKLMNIKLSFDYFTAYNLYNWLSVYFKTKHFSSQVCWYINIIAGNDIFR